MSRKETYPFPKPIGEISVYGMDHEEVRTLPYHLPKKPNYVDFKLALTDEAANAIKLFHGIGLLNPRPMRLGDTKVSPLKVLLRLLPSPSQTAGKIHGSAGVLVEVRGEKSGEPQVVRSYVMMTHDEAYERHRSNATSYLTGTPTALCALMLAQGRIESRGVIVPERMNAQQFLEEAPRYDLRIQLDRTQGGQ
jgi:saccharopine dehydrogenase-like NADP-dependent oxidoreductase